MTGSTLSKIWSFLALTLLYFTLNVWSLTQQWQLSFPGNPFREGNLTPFSATLYGIPVCSALIILLCITTNLYAARARSKVWAGRWPKLLNISLNVAKPEARAMQAISLLVFLGIPTVGLLHFGNKFLHGTAYRR